MTKTISMDDFLNAVNSFKTGTYNIDELIQQFTRLLNSNENLSEQSIIEIKSLINSSELPRELVEKLTHIVTSQKTRIFIPSSDPFPFNTSNTESKTSDHKSTSYSSSLFKELLQWENSAQNKEVKAGQTIRGTYKLVSKIGQGGMGEVWKAIDLIQDAGDSQDKYVAIKFLNQEVRNHPDALKALVREFARYKRLIHPNIVRAYEINRDENEIFIVMEFLSGVSLKEFIQQHPNGISLTEAKPVIGGMCKALNYAHQEGIIHLDFKPGNIFYDEKIQTAKVIDFGIARLANKEDRDKTRFDPGILKAVSTAYASTEMLLMDEEPDPRDDVYGLACVSYELLSGKHAFNRTSALKAEREKMVPRPIKGIKDSEYQALVTGLSFHRNDRTSTPEQFFQALYSSNKSPRNKHHRWLIIAPIILIAIILTPTIFKKNYDSWKNEQIINELNENQANGIKEFLEFSPDKQHELLLDNSAKMALVHFVINNKKNKLEVIDFLSNLSPKVQDLLFKNSEVSKLLISQCIDNIDLALIADDIEMALALTSKIIDKYPNSKPLAEKLETVINWKENRLSLLGNTFYQCINETSKSLQYLFPCFQETYEHLSKLSPQHKQLYNPELSARYTDEISNLIKKDDYNLAETLLSSWRILVPAENNKRRQLTRIVKTKKSIQNAINSAQLAEVNQILKELEKKYSKEEKQRILLSIEKPLISFYHEQIQEAIKQDAFSAADTIADEGLMLFPNTASLVSIKNDIRKEKNQRITNILTAFRDSLYSSTSNGKEILSHLLILRIIDNSYLDKDPGIYNALETRILELADSDESFNKLQDLIVEWEKFLNGGLSSQNIKKKYQKSKNLIALRCLSTGQRLKRMGNNELSNEFIMFGLTLNPIKTVRRALEKELLR
jgi:serine/threonine protein kinase